MPAVLFLFFLGMAMWLRQIPVLLFWFYLIMSAFTFLLYAVDKAAAREHRERVSENALHVFALIGGWPGAWLARDWLRHKSNKASFRLIFACTAMLNLLALVSALWFSWNGFLNFIRIIK